MGRVTDIDGKFTIDDCPSSATTLVVSFVGLRTEEVAIAPGVLNIMLKSATESLDEVVVTAQGLSRKEKSIGYSAQKVDGEKLTAARQTDLGNAMAGKIAGARFFGASGATFDSGSIVLRGSSDFLSPEGSEPIYVVDGSITNKNAVNMDDVESINVLKGAAATALYGSQGGNGAVIITTKKAEGGKGRIEVSHTLTFDKYYNHFDMQKQYGGGSYGYDGAILGNYDEYKDVDTMNPAFLYGNQYGEMVNADGTYYMDFGSDESWGARYDKNVLVATPLYYDETSAMYGKAKPWVHGLDMADLFQTGVSNTTNISFAKAGKDYSSRISFTNSTRDGVQQNSDAVRRYLAVKTSYKPADWVNVSLDYKYTYRRNHNGASEGYGAATNAFHEYLQWGQTQVDLDDYRDYMRPDGSWRTWNVISPTNNKARFHDNPYALFDKSNSYTTYRWNVFTGDVTFNLPFNIKAGVRVIGNMRAHDSETKRNDGSINFSSYFYAEQGHVSDLTTQGSLTWGDRFIDDRLSVDAAAFIEQRNYDYKYVYGNTNNGLIMDGYFNIAASNGAPTVINYEQHYKTRSIFGTATVGFDDTYFLDGSIRNDWDSRLPVANNSFLYGGLSASVMLNQLIKDVEWLDYWKIRGSFAQVGSTLGAYNTIMAYNYTNSSNYNYKYNNMTSLYPSATQLNPSIKPTISTSYEVGTEFRLFENRFWGDINYYSRDTKNQILNMNVAPQSGFNSRQLNSGLVRNRGVEISLGGTPVQTKNFQWNVEGNISKNKNELVELNKDMTKYQISWSSFQYRWYLWAEEGQPLGQIKTMARWKRNDEGKLVLQPTTASSWGGGWRPIYELNKEEQVGNFQPDWTGGFSTNIKYKNFRLAANFDFSIGGQMVSWTNMWAAGSGLSARTAELNDKGVNVREPLSKGGGIRVDGVDEDGKPVTAYMNAYQYYHELANVDLDEWIYDRTYVKMRELSVSYDFPKNLLKKAGIGLNDASISFVATNPWLIYSACPNVDPSESGSNWIEGGQAASTRSFGFTVKLGF
ncbi:MAG: SusC/RagA family TonB-linked outer membrane protein [Bacteroidaceae bacterium]|nr:SusC/RagA family TonB-linked outer membrane protein [Bacteroidaceae bacterium]